MAKVISGKSLVPYWWAINAAGLAKTVREGFDYDPGHSDLDDEQPIHVRMTLGDYRKAVQVSSANKFVNGS